MTHTKAERIKQELLDKYGDRELMQVFEMHTNRLLGITTLSEVNIHNTGELVLIKRILASGKPLVRKVALVKGGKR